jgi:hypothetical protein
MVSPFHNSKIAAQLCLISIIVISMGHFVREAREEATG